MSPVDIRRLAEWRDVCRNDTGVMAAYFFDF